MLKRIWVKNYRSLGDINLTLEPVTILVGQNGAGKSNLVDALWFVSDAIQMGLNNAILKRHGIYPLYRWSANDRPYDIEIGLTVETKTWHGSYSFVLGGSNKNEYRIKKESCFIHDQEGRDHRFEAIEGTWIQKPDQLTPAIQEHTLILPLIAELPPYKKLHDFLTRVSFYNIDPDTLIQPQKPTTPYPLEREGKNIASTLWEMEQTQSPLLESLRHSIQAVIPNIIDFGINKSGGYLLIYLQHDMGERKQPAFDLIQESDGTLRMLGILVALYQEQSPVLLVLEEPELNIHPGALRMLWDEIESAATRSQILITTHSPDLLDMCQAEQLRIVEKVNGITLIDPVETAQKEAIQERLFAPGELLRAQGLKRQQLPLL